MNSATYFLLTITVLFSGCINIATATNKGRPKLQSSMLPPLNIGPVAADFDTYTYEKGAASSNLFWAHTSGNIASTGRPYSAYYAIFDPDYFAFKSAAPGTCPELVETSKSAQSYDCEYATNGGFFTWNMPESGSLCIGNMVSDGQVLQMPTDGSGTTRANFGVTGDGKIILGFLDELTIRTTGFTQLMTGYGWLVRNGVSNVQNSTDLSFDEGGFTLEKAPRTAVGVFKNGSMCLFEVDGEEDIDAGPDLFEMAELMVDIGIESAVNIDGGGSSTVTYNGNVIDEPTCVDTSEICERAVASITCVKRNL